MTRLYQLLLRLYPVHIRVIYGKEKLASFQERQSLVRGRVGAVRLFIGELCRMVPDITCERVAMLSSHPSFRGPRAPDSSIVRPPNMGKKQWFYSETD